MRIRLLFTYQLHGQETTRAERGRKNTSTYSTLNEEAEFISAKFKSSKVQKLLNC